MSLSVLHALHCPIADAPDADLDPDAVRPSDWNHEHVLTVSQASILGAASAGVVVDLTPAEARSILGVREVLTANRSYYVRADGNNANSGLVDSAFGAWATPQYAADFIGTYIDFAGFRVTVNVGAGSYGGVYNRPYVGGGAIYWKGDINTPGNVVLGNATNPSGFTIGSFNILEHTGTIIWVNGFRMAPTAGPCLDADPASAGDSIIVFGDLENFAVAKLELAGCANGGSVVIGNVLDLGNSIVVDGSELTNPGVFWNAITDTRPSLGSTITFQDSPTFSVAVLQINTYAMLTDFATWSGTVNGPRYYVQTHGYFNSISPDSGPGSSAGTVEPGGVIRYTGADGVFWGTRRLGENMNLTVAGGATQLTNLQSGKHVDNIGAASLASVTLPNAQVDLEYTFTVSSANGIRVIAKAGDTIQVRGTTSASGGNIESLVPGDTVRLRAINATEWVALFAYGAWAGVETITVANEATDTSCFIGFFTAATGALQPKTNTSLIFDSSTGFVGIGSAGLTLANMLTINRATLNVVTEYRTNGTTRALIGVSNDAGGVINGSVVGDLMMRTQGGDLRVSLDSGSTTHLRLTTTALTLTTSTVLTTGTLELGHASDTTIARVSAGVASIEGVNLLASNAAGIQAFLTTPSSANLATAVTDETGSGALVFATSPTLVTPILGTPTSGTLTNCTGLPSIVVANEATDTSCFLAFFTAASGELGPKTNANMTFNSNTGVVTFASSVLTTTDIDGGTIDGTVIGGASAAAGTFTTILGTTITASTGFVPDADDGAFLGQAGTAFADLFLAETGTINFDSGEAVLSKVSGASQVALSGSSNASLVLNHTAGLNMLGSTARPFQMYGAEAGSASAVIGVFGTGATDQAAILIYRSRSATKGEATVVQNNDSLGGIFWTAAQQTGTFTNQTLAGAINLEVDGTVTSGAGADMPTRMIFSVGVDGGSSTEAMRLNSGLNLKVGGTVNRGTTEGTKHIDVFNGTAPAGTLANGFSLYSSGGFAFSNDALGNAAVIDAEQLSIQAADRTGNDSATAQAVFDAAQDTLTVTGATSYEFEAHYWMTRAAGTTSHTTGILFAGTATFTSIEYVAIVGNPTGNVLATGATLNMMVGAAATEIVVTPANTAATENLYIKLRGTMRINAGGTLIPQFKYSAAPGGAPTIKANTFFRLWAIGTNTVATVGAWA